MDSNYKGFKKVLCFGLVSYPIYSMYGIFTKIWLKFTVSVGK